MARILVCDDHDLLRGLIVSQLAEAGHDVVAAASAAEAGALLDAGPLDLVVLDLHLGAQSGLVVLEDVRARGSTPVILLSGDFAGPGEAYARRYGADAVLPKPFEAEQLSDVVRSLLRAPRNS